MSGAYGVMVVMVVNSDTGLVMNRLLGESAYMSNAFVCLFKVPKRVFHSFVHSSHDACY